MYRMQQKSIAIESLEEIYFLRSASKGSNKLKTARCIQTQKEITIYSLIERMQRVEGHVIIVIDSRLQE